MYHLFPHIFRGCLCRVALSYACTILEAAHSIALSKKGPMLLQLVTLIHCESRIRW